MTSEEDIKDLLKLEEDTESVSVCNNILLRAVVLSSEETNRKLKLLISIMERVEENQVD